MDSVTQFALGAAVGGAVLGPLIGPRRAIIAGGVLGTLPDLDVLYPFDGPIESFTLHRGPTHSLVVQAVAAPLFGEIMVRLFKPLRDARLRTYAAVYLCFATHALLDAMTVYGTRILWPIWPDPVGIGSIFIIDPLYTIPLLVAVVWALCLRAWTSRFGAVLAAALALSTGYLGWSAAAQAISGNRAALILRDNGVEVDRLMATPTPFNTLLWRVIAVDGDRYYNLYVPLLGAAEDVTAYVHARRTGTSECAESIAAAAQLAAFSDGFYRTDVEQGSVVVSDLRMGLTPNYVFRFVVAEQNGAGLSAVAPRRQPVTRIFDGDLEWLLVGLSGNGAVRPAEAAALVDGTRFAAQGRDGGGELYC